MKKELIAYATMIVMLPLFLAGGILLLTGSTMKSLGYLFLTDVESARQESKRI